VTEFRPGCLDLGLVSGDLGAGQLLARNGVLHQSLGKEKEGMKGADKNKDRRIRITRQGLREVRLKDTG
jgi:hypothetical protein